jgi:hypothetical protein
MAEALPLNFSRLSQTIDDILETLPQVKFIKNIINREMIFALLIMSIVFCV